MAIHQNNKKIVEEALQDTLILIKNGIDFQKGDGGCLGYPSANLLFSIVDTLGSYLRGSKFEVLIEGKSIKIEKASHHFFILNSHYFNLGLSEDSINKIYESYRSKLIHNLSLPINHILSKGSEADKIIEFEKDSNGKLYPYKINLYPFYIACENAVRNFLHDIKSPAFEATVFGELNDKSKDFNNPNGIKIIVTDSGQTRSILSKLFGKF